MGLGFLLFRPESLRIGSGCRNPVIRGGGGGGGAWSFPLAENNFRFSGLQRLAGLKKAYADVILSISKEAAARVMASEKKSVMYQHELKVAKDEGLRMMLRLKQMMDYQIYQSQATLSNQQKKIDELEAQLQEAEDIVSDLRAELRQAQAELEREKKPKNTYHVNGLVHTYPNEKNPVINNLYRYQSVDYLPPNASSQIDLPSIILRSKEPGLYRKNGCTQRIRACDRNLLDRDLSLSEEIPKESKELEKNKTLPNIKLIGFNSISSKGKRAIRKRKTVIPCIGTKSAYSDSAQLSLDKDLTQNLIECEDICDNERDVIEFSGEKTMEMDKNGVIEEMDNVQKADGPSSCIMELISSECAEGISGRPVRERDYKYTFQRKRKRQAPSESNINGSLEMGKKTFGENNADKKVEKLKTSLSMESSRDSRRLAQVARQLISLSESKWWN
ncbi:Unknown protein [Striga hermonthica]|uniref:Uncharacterized protein n=1 Tax=Striga hermonthica TaxID=68872 RepID=A0A9N7NBL2_STRHE|nr:Unknown protein [Striga hermonthica]